MAFELKDGQGTLFRNNKKVDGSMQPDYRGELSMNGVLCEIAGWIKEGQKGKWMSLSVKPKEAPAEQPTTRRATGEPGNAPDSDIPF